MSSIPEDTAKGIRQARALGVCVNAIARGFNLTEQEVYSVLGEDRQPAWKPAPQREFDFEDRA